MRPPSVIAILSPKISPILPYGYDTPSENPPDYRIVQGHNTVLDRFHNVRFQSSQLL
ncbi:MAG: hypothetical protein HP494_05595 [Nitrospira sp.]|nr:hypothetical protein [Nitrospira sp.]